MRWPLALTAIGILLGACGTETVTTGILGPGASGVGVKMLRPAAVGRVCRASLLGFVQTSKNPLLAEALEQILALDPEGDAVANARVRWDHVTTGVYNRHCVEVRGDLVRVVPTMVLGGPAGHADHMAH